MSEVLFYVLVKQSLLYSLLGEPGVDSAAAYANYKLLYGCFSGWDSASLCGKRAEGWPIAGVTPWVSRIMVFMEIPATGVVIYVQVSKERAMSHFCYLSTCFCYEILYILKKAVSHWVSFQPWMLNFIVNQPWDNSSFKVQMNHQPNPEYWSFLYLK